MNLKMKTNVTNEMIEEAIKALIEKHKKRLRDLAVTQELTNDWSQIEKDMLYNLYIEEAKHV